MKCDKKLSTWVSPVATILTLGKPCSLLTLDALSLVAEAKAVLSSTRVVKSRGKLSRAVWNM